MEIYLVGGAVRDKLMGRPVQDRDFVVVGSTPDEMTARGFKLVGADFPVFLHPETKEEYALARTERKSGVGYKGFTVYAGAEVTLDEDLQRRDLTINAMAEDATGHLIDPFNGAADLKKGILRHVSSAFVEDPLRVLRVARFAARFGFAVAHETLVLMREIVAAGEMESLVSERVWMEFERALAEPEPERFIEVLRECGALSRILPEVDALFGVPQKPEYHPEIDTGVHTVLVLRQAARLSSDPRVRFAALMHDIGKGATPPDQWPSHHGHEGRGADMLASVAHRLRIPNEFRELATLVARHHQNCHRAATLRAATLLDMLQSIDGFRRPERVQFFVLACEADFRGRPGHEQRPYPQRDIVLGAFKAARDIDTAVATAGKSGPAAGEAIRQARIAAVAAALARFSA